MSRELSRRVSALEASFADRNTTRRVLRHVLDCEPSERSHRIAAIEAAEPTAFHIVRVIVTPGEMRMAA